MDSIQVEENENIVKNRDNSYNSLLDNKSNLKTNNKLEVSYTSYDSGNNDSLIRPYKHPKNENIQ
jgi:hypothetical protein